MINEKQIKNVKTGIRVGVTILVDLFTGAVTNKVLAGTNGGKLKKLGAKAGGLLVSIYIGDQVADHICSGLDQLVADVQEIEKNEKKEEKIDA